jgi:hypothetical protein
MRRGSRALAALALVAGAGALAATEYRLVDRRSTEGIERQRVGKVVVLAISDDDGVRKPFENKLVSHLRGRGIAAVASHPVVPDLTAAPSRERVVQFIDEQQVDAVLTVRAVGLESTGEAAWVEAWNTWLRGPSTVRDLVERTIPVPRQRAKRYGVEFALWDLRTPRRLWAARTGVHSLKELRRGVSELLLVTIEELEEARWF